MLLAGASPGWDSGGMTTAAEAGPLVHRHVVRRAGAFFLLVLSVVPLAFGTAFLFGSRENLGPSLGLAAMGAAGVLLSRWLLGRTPRCIRVHEAGLVVEYARRAVFVPWSDVKSVTLTRTDAGVPAYEIGCGLEKPIRVVPASDGEEPTEHLVALVTERAGLE